ncbi:Pycsar system effector family protein [Vibrio vulnificus]
MDDKLKDIFANINDWLKYAEAKSATLIAGNAALIFGLSRILKSYDVPQFVEYSGYVAMALCLISMILCLLSVVPSLSMPWESKPSGAQDSDNLLYFKDIAKYTPVNYLGKLASRLDLDEKEFSGYQRDLANQIIVNATIACRKYNYFQTAVWLTVSALISPVGSIILYILRVRK